MEFFGSGSAVSRRASCFLTTSICIVVLGCQPTSQSDTSRTVVNPPEVGTTVDVSGGEIWDLIQISDATVGYQVTRWQVLHEDGESIREVRAEGSLKIRRFGQTTEQRMEISNRETLDGRLLSFSSSISGTSSSLQSTGRVEGGQLHLTTRSGEKSQSWSIPLDKSCGGPFAAELSLLRRPMQPGEQRKLSLIMPVLNVVAEVVLQAHERQPTELIDESRRLLRITSDTQVPGGQSIRTMMWCDAGGQVLKSSVPAMNQTTYRVTQAEALAPVASSFDLGDASIVKVSTRLRNPHATNRIRYRARLAGGDPTDTFAATAYQTVTRRADRVAEVDVRRVRPSTEPVQRPDAPPTEADRSSSPVIQTDDRIIRQLADQIDATEDDPWETAIAIERFVHEFVRQKNFSTAFATAAEVARQRAGDCTEHAVLTAALCRVRRIPCRVVIGMVYVPSKQGFGFHMWNEVWIRDRWIPIDSTLGRGGIGAAHLALTRSSLPAEESFSAFLQVMSVIGQLELEVLSVD